MGSSGRCDNMDKDANGKCVCIYCKRYVKMIEYNDLDGYYTTVCPTCKMVNEVKFMVRK